MTHPTAVRLRAVAGTRRESDLASSYLSFDGQLIDQAGRSWAPLLKVGFPGTTTSVDPTYD